MEPSMKKEAKSTIRKLRMFFKGNESLYHEYKTRFGRLNKHIPEIAFTSYSDDHIALAVILVRRSRREREEVYLNALPLGVQLTDLMSQTTLKKMSDCFKHDVTANLITEPQPRLIYTINRHYSG